MVDIISNEFDYIDNVTVGYKQPIVHVMNKAEVIYSGDRKLSKNILVVGDLMDDVGMVKEEIHDIVLKIGYLNDMKKHGHQLPDYLNTFDILITDDGSLHPINYII